MTDRLYVYYDKSFKDGAAICVSRLSKDGITDVVKMLLDKDAEKLYKLLTDQSMKLEK